MNEAESCKECQIRGLRSHHRSTCVRFLKCIEVRKSCLGEIPGPFEIVRDGRHPTRRRLRFSVRQGPSNHPMDHLDLATMCWSMWVTAWWPLTGGTSGRLNSAIDAMVMNCFRDSSLTVHSRLRRQHYRIVTATPQETPMVLIQQPAHLSSS